MNQKIFNNIILFFVVLYIIKSVSPHQDSVLYVLQKYLNYIIFKIKNLLACIGIGKEESFKDFENTTFTGVTKYNNKTPSFKTSHEVNYVKYFSKVSPDIPETKVYKLYNFIKHLISIDVDQFFSTPSNIISNEFTESEKLKLQTIILNKLNSGTQFTFSEFNFESNPKYYLNLSGKEIDSFVFNVKSNIGIIRIYIDINIRTDVYENKEFIVINDIKPIIDENASQNASQNISNIKSKIKRTPFNGDATLIFTNKAKDNFTYEDIEVEKVVVKPKYIKSTDNSNNPPEINAQSNNLFAYNEYDNLDFINNNNL